VYSAAAEWERQFSDRLSGVAGASLNKQNRNDASDADEWSYVVGASYTVTDNTRLRGSYARQIRFPTLRDLYEAGRGNPELLPERTHNFELALAHDLPDGRSDVEFVLYRVDADDFIERGLSGVAENFEQLRFQGVEFNGRYFPAENMQLRLSYTFLDAENRGENAATTAVQNRPRHKFSLRADYDFSTGTRLYATVLRVSGALALSRNEPVVTTETGSYNVFDIGVSQSFRNDRMRLIARVENLFDENYQESFGFPQPGRRFYVGAEFRL
jgi:outer membrane receptor protein involved in Fe transport